MKSIALTLAVLFSTLTFAQAADQAAEAPKPQEEILDVNAQKNPDGTEEVQIEAEQQPAK